MKMLLDITYVDEISVRVCQEPCVYFWGVKHGQSLSLLMNKFISKIQNELETRSPPSNVNELDNEKICCVLINKEWHRARVTEPKLSPLGTLQVFCIDNGKSYSIPLSLVRTVNITGVEADHIRQWPPLATKFILADMIGPQVPNSGRQWSKPAMNFLKTHLENHTWKAVPLGIHAGYQGVRLFDSANKLFAATMIQEELGVPSETYQDALSMSKDLNEQPAVTEIPVDLAAQEILFVIFLVGEPCEPCSFFGKLCRVPIQDQDEMAIELLKVYSSLPNPPPLYVDGMSRLGHHGVLQCNEDQNYHRFRRVLIINEMPNGLVEVYFIDYGNTLWIPRHKILASCYHVNHFRQHGIHCKLNGNFSFTACEWKSLVQDKWVEVNVGEFKGGYYSVTFTDNSINEKIGDIVRSKATDLSTKLFYELEVSKNI